MSRISILGIAEPLLYLFSLLRHVFWAKYTTVSPYVFPLRNFSPIFLNEILFRLKKTHISLRKWLKKGLGPMLSAQALWLVKWQLSQSAT